MENIAESLRLLSKTFLINNYLKKTQLISIQMVDI